MSGSTEHGTVVPPPPDNKIDGRGLPEELFSQICSLCDMPTLKSCRLGSSFLKRIAEEHLYRTVNVHMRSTSFEHLKSLLQSPLMTNIKHVTFWAATDRSPVLTLELKELSTDTPSDITYALVNKWLRDKVWEDWKVTKHAAVDRADFEWVFVRAFYDGTMRTERAYAYEIDNAYEQYDHELELDLSENQWQRGTAHYLCSTMEYWYSQIGSDEQRKRRALLCSAVYDKMFVDLASTHDWEGAPLPSPRPVLTEQERLATRRIFPLETLKFP